MLVPEMVGGDHYDTTRERFLPFAVGTIDPSKGFVHVIDDFSLDVLLKTVDTAEDLARYLQQKESLVLSRRLGHAAGEEDLLAYYLSRADKGGQHYFDVPADSTAIFIGEGFWESFQSHPDRLAQIEADRVSYAWDDLIEKFTQHLLGGTQYYQSDPSVPAQEVALRFLAAERRFHRRILAKGLRGLLQLGDTQDRATRVVLPRSSGDPCYVFLSFKPRQDRTPEQYRTVRRNILGALCMVTRMRFPDARHIVGIATEPWGTGATRSEDFVYLDGTSWDDEQAAEAARLQTEFGFLTDVKQWKMNEPEYPRERDRKLRKGRNRNRACPCGSGRKYKKCCGLL